MNLSKIQWTDATWNPVRGCSRVSRGCEHCYAEQIAGRFSGEGMPYRGFAETNSYHSQTGRPTTGSRGRWTGKVELIESKLEEPLHWREPRRVFVNSMSDLFHESLSQKDVADVFDVMAKASQHTFQVLTKRPKRMLQFCDGMRRLFERFDREDSSAAVKMRTVYPLPNVWLGVSVEDQATADERIPLLLRTPAAVHFVSYEPALDAVDFVGYLPAVVGRDLSEGQRAFQEELRAEVKRHGWSSIGWLIVGGESGPGARRFDLAWARSAISQCRAAGIPVFVKQIGSNPTTDHRTRPAGEDPFRLYRDGKGGNPSEWPEDLKVREFPS